MREVMCLKCGRVVGGGLGDYAHDCSGSWGLREPCAGSAALSLYMLGARRSIMPYQGSKWRYRTELGVVVRNLGFRGRPDVVSLEDPGPWGLVWPTLADMEARAVVLEALRELDALDPRECYERLTTPAEGLEEGLTPLMPAATEARFLAPVEVARFLFLQRLAFSGKAVGWHPSGRGGIFKSPGFNGTSAYGRAATERFGKVNPMIPSLIRAIEALPEVPWSPLTRGAARRWVDYIDPPYLGTTGYPDGTMSREEVLHLARESAGSGASVIVSESEPLKELTSEGWGAKLISAGRGGASPFRGSEPGHDPTAEWVTYWRGA